MKKPRPLDHPEHWADLIEKRSTELRDVPADTRDYLFDMARYRCSICEEPWLEIHHIQELKKNGRTEYANLIVLCPNCHTRVHVQGFPSPTQLRQIKQKQEIAHVLPTIGRLEDSDWDVLRFFSKLPDDEIGLRALARSISVAVMSESKMLSQDDAELQCRRTFAHYLAECGIVDFRVPYRGSASGLSHRVDVEIRLTEKGIKWLRYLKATRWAKERLG